MTLDSGVANGQKGENVAQFESVSFRLLSGLNLSLGHFGSRLCISSAYILWIRIKGYIVDSIV